MMLTKTLGGCLVFRNIGFLFILCFSIFGQSFNHANAEELILSFLVDKDVSDYSLRLALNQIDPSIELTEYRELANDNLANQNICSFNMASIRVQDSEQAVAVRKLDGLSESVSWVPSSTEAVRRLSLGTVSQSTYSSSSSFAGQNASLDYTGKGIRIAVLDTGFAQSQAILDAWQQGNAIKLVQPFNFTSDDPTDFFDRYDKHEGLDTKYVGHGTAIAALSAANHPEYQSAAPDAELMPLKVCNDDGSCLTTHVIQGLCYALNNAPQTYGKADPSKLVINLSFGTPEASKGLYDVLEYALASGASVVVSGGNEGEEGSPARYPAAFGAQNPAGFEPLQGLVVVSAIESTNYSQLKVASFSTQGDFIDLAAVGTRVLSAPADAFSFSDAFSGTSFAAPQVAASLAQLKEALPNASPKQLESILKENALSLDCTTCSQQTVGAGLLNPESVP